MNKISKHADICKNLNDLYQRKNADYGDSFGKSYKEYGMTMACIRLEDKLNRLKSLSRQEAQVKDESLEDTLMDLANYAIMTLIELHGDKVENIPKVKENHFFRCVDETPDCICLRCKNDCSNCCIEHKICCSDQNASCPDFVPEGERE